MTTAEENPMKKLEVAKLILNISVRARTCGRRVEDRAGFSRYVPLAAAPRHACRARRRPRPGVTALCVPRAGGRVGRSADARGEGARAALGPDARLLARALHRAQLWHPAQ